MEASRSKRGNKEIAGANTRPNQELQAALKYTEAIIATIREPFIVLDASLRVVSANRSFYKLFLVKPEETEGKLIYEIGNKQWDIPKLRELLEGILPKNKSFNDFEVDNEFPQLGRRIMLLNAHRLQNGGQKTQRILLAIEDITDRRLAEQQIVSSELRYRRLFETAQDGILILDAETGEITDANPFLSEMLGYSKQELLGKQLWTIGFFKDIIASRKAFKVLQDKGYIRYEDLPLETRDGKPMEVEFVSNVYTTDGEKVIQCNIRDITIRKKAEGELQKSERLYHSLFENMLDGFAYCQMVFKEGHPHDFIYLTVNSAFEKLTGLKDVVGKRATEVIPGLRESNPKLFEIYGRVALTGRTKKFELYLAQLARWFSISVYSPGKGYFVAVFDNITERRQAEEAFKSTLEESQTRSREVSALLDGARAVLACKGFKETARAIFDSCENLIGATGGYVALLNKEGTANEVLFLEAGGRPCDVDPTLPMPIRGLRCKAYQNGKAVYNNDFAKSKWAVFMPDGHVALDNVLFAPLMLQGKPFGLIGLANKEGGFTEHDARIASAFADLAAIALQNSRTLDSLQTERDKLTGILDNMKDSVYIIARNGDIEYANPALKRELGPIEGRKCYSYLHDREEVCPWCNNEEVFAGKTMRWEKYLPKTNKTYDFIDTPLKNHDGTISKLEIFHDISERKKVEQVKDEFIGLVSHELKTPITVIMGSINTALSEGISKETAKELLENAASSTGSLATIIDNLLELSWAQANHLMVRKEPVVISEAARKVAETLKKRAKLHQIIVDIPTGIPAVQADQVRLERVLYNLIENAIKYSPDGGTITVFARQKDDYLDVGVKDNGIGISQEDQAKLFKPFERLETVNGIDGIGLGLNVCRQLIEAYGGSVRVESELGKGATFFFTLPLV